VGASALSGKEGKITTKNAAAKVPTAATAFSNYDEIILDQELVPVKPKRLRCEATGTEQCEHRAFGEQRDRESERQSF
jgi:hypothetical protein